ncbi:MAG: gas vesicle protein K [Anaerolineales bacterium]|nr:gas vesicle protein K [Anaerolineales bacterium]
MPGIDGNNQRDEKLLCSPGDLEAFATELERAEKTLPRRINVDPEKVSQGLAQLVLTLIELLRQLMERQALRRIEGGSLSDEEIERLGQTFMKLEARMDELKQIFDLEDEDLNLHLGPLGDLM